MGIIKIYPGTSHNNFFMTIIALTIQLPRTSPKLVAPNISLCKDTLSKIALFLKYNCTYTFE